MAGKKSFGRQERRIHFNDDLIWGIHPVVETLLASKHRILEVFLLKQKRGKSWENMLRLIKEKGVRYHFLERLTITGVPDGNVAHQGVVARVTPAALIPFDDLLIAFAAEVEAGGKPRILACDSIQDPHNLGAVIRSAHAAGVNRILVTRERTAPLGGIVSKASAGALSRVDICQVTNLRDALKAVKKAGGWIFGAVNEESAQSIYQTDFNVPACLVIGNEGQGIRPLIRQQCDIMIAVPMHGDFDSLNCSVAGAVIMFEMHRQLLEINR